ncbi:glycosyltransferase family 90 protein [Loigolactobacillus iwatensis]|uniref:glycosyltransferase family 90 protein n=1 Tax=Loigolactobacillus iwatensis TaxID=1267156 RepID=UPI001CDCD0CE|nr:glycosyltransferase family 90 protein [Loigolactobacillus iwatensis]
MHHEDIRPLEEAGFTAAMTALEEFKHKNLAQELHVVQRFYRERHRRMNLPAPSNNVMYGLFLQVFHAEYEFFQQAMTSGRLSTELAEQLQQHLVFDEMAYIHNRNTFIN